MSYVLEFTFPLPLILIWALLVLMFRKYPDQHDEFWNLYLPYLSNTLCLLLWLDFLLVGPYFYSLTILEYTLFNFWPRAAFDYFSVGFLPVVTFWAALLNFVRLSRLFGLAHMLPTFILKFTNSPLEFFFTTLPDFLCEYSSRFLNDAREARRVSTLVTTLSTWLTTTVVDISAFLPRYYQLNDLLWQDGFLIDFLQKKMVDKWTRKFLIYSGYLFNERLVFDWVVRFYIDLVIWPTYRVMIYEFTNVASTLLATLFIFLVLFLVFTLGYVGILLF